MRPPGGLFSSARVSPKKVDRDIQQTYFLKDYSERETQDILLDTWAREHNPKYQSGISKTL